MGFWRHPLQADTWTTLPADLFMAFRRLRSRQEDTREPIDHNDNCTFGSLRPSGVCSGLLYTHAWVAMAFLAHIVDFSMWTSQEGWRADRKTVEAFLHLVEREYLPNSYHNNIHAADVTQTAAIIMQSVALHLDEIPKIEAFCIIIAAAVHDLGHLGVNNDFLVNSKHPRATTFNDKSVNENYHISRAFEVVRTVPGCDIFEPFTFDEQKKVYIISH